MHLLALAVLLSQASQPDAQDRLSVDYGVSVAARLNPLGLFAGGALMLRYHLYDSESDALKQNFIGVGPVAFLSPAFGRVGLGVEVQPLTLLKLSASYELIGFWGGFNLFQSYGSATAETSDRELSRLKPTSYKAIGGMLSLAAMFRIKLGPIVVRSNLQAFNYQMRLRDGDRTWYEPVLDIMSPGHGWVMSNDSDLLYVTNFGLALGVRYTITHAFFTAADFAPGESQVNANSPIQRMGPLIAYTFYDDPNARHFNTPTLAILTQWFIQHRYRAGQEVARAIPWFALAFLFKGAI